MHKLTDDALYFFWIFMTLDNNLLFILLRMYCIQ